ncbi:hypothetical protein ACFWB0_04640 [Rhodococcus sp. NPDC060086]|uniref:hypothetical protein n=1 Tax=Rhodococcus sp. NPDC060086 TaxID=3347055 RepID=UPI00365B055E
MTSRTTSPRRAIAAWDEKLEQTQRRLAISGRATTSGAEVVRDIRDEYDRGEK